jgi:hypothetical protein
MSGHVPGPHGFDLNRDKDRIELLCWAAGAGAVDRQRWRWEPPPLGRTG